MRKIILLSFLSLDGVMQAPGGPQEDTSGGFKYGGWTAPFFDDFAGQEMARQMQPADLLLGRKTFDIFEAYWPQHSQDWPKINDATKYVVSTTRDHSPWQNSVFLQSAADIKRVKATTGLDLQVHGSSQLAGTLLQNNLVDELWLKIFPLTLGKGKRLFGEQTPAAAYTLTSSLVSPRGVIFANYRRHGGVLTGSY